MRNCRKAGQEIYTLAAKLFPICRSNTGEGGRQTLGIISRALARDGVELTVHEVPTGPRAFDRWLPKNGLFETNA